MLKTKILPHPIEILQMQNDRLGFTLNRKIHDHEHFNIGINHEAARKGFASYMFVVRMVWVSFHLSCIAKAVCGYAMFYENGSGVRGCALIVASAVNAFVLQQNYI